MDDTMLPRTRPPAEVHRGQDTLRFRSCARRARQLLCYTGFALGLPGIAATLASESYPLTVLAVSGAMALAALVCSAPGLRLLLQQRHETETEYESTSSYYLGYVRSAFPAVLGVICALPAMLAASALFSASVAPAFLGICATLQYAIAACSLLMARSEQ